MGWFLLIELKQIPRWGTRGKVLFPENDVTNLFDLPHDHFFGIFDFAKRHSYDSRKIIG